tara:strand:+ start:893 stop:1093 length:201 start_codon:yes stop_codon:yes gene_type:complete
MEVEINTSKEFPETTGLMSTIHFDRPEFIEGLNEMFEVQPSEVISKVYINKGSITALFKAKGEQNA